MQTTTSKEPRLKWGPYSPAEHHGTGHFLFLGATGSGKTVLIRMLMKSVFGSPSFTASGRALVYDAKRDFMPDAARLGVADRVSLLHPFDTRGLAWNIADDVTSPIVARQLATVLVPESEHSSGADQFFTQAVRELCTAVLMEMGERRGKDWTFRDFILTILFPDVLQRFLARSELLIARRVNQMYLEGNERTVKDIVSTIGTKMGIYDAIAASWDKRRRDNGSESIRSWIESNRILVLGNDEGARTSLDAVNRALFQRVTEEVLNRSEEQEGRTWVFLDEVREAEYLDGLRRLMNKGRSKGACVVLGCQDIEGMRSVYGQEEGGEILGQCNHVVVLNLVSPETAEWASKLFGQSYLQIRDTNSSVGASYSEGETRKEEMRWIVTTEELLTMRRIHPSSGISGYYRSPALLESSVTSDWTARQRIAPWKAGGDTYNWDKAVSSFLPDNGLRRKVSWPEFVEGDPRDQVLQDWSVEERERILGNDDDLSESAVGEDSSPVMKALRARIEREK